MTAYRTCLNCAHPKAECATLSRIRHGIAGLGITSVKFTCPDRAPLYRPGDRVSVTWSVPQCEEPLADDYLDESWPATVVEEKGARFIICVDDVSSDNDTPARWYIKSPNLYAKVSAGKLKPLAGERRSVCGICGVVADNGFEQCWQRGGVVPQRGCLRVQVEAAAA